MKFTCDSCSAQYMISDEKVGPNGVKVRCKKCGNVIVVRRAAEVPAVAPAAAAPAPAAGDGGAPAPAPGLDAELGQAFDSAFGDKPAATAAAPDPGATQAMGVEDRAKVAAAPEPAPTEWYVAIGQAQVGPLPLAEVKRKWEAGDIGPDSLVWRPGMGDWQPLSGVAELSGYLAPIARTPAPRPHGEPQPFRTEPLTVKEKEKPTQTPAPGADVTWKPAGASALAALANEEIATRAPEQKPAAAHGAAADGAKSLVEGLPDGGGVDPTGAIPLSIKGLDTTGEKKLERRSTVASRAEETRHKRSLTRVVMTTVAVVVLAGGGAAAYFFSQKAPAPPPVAVAPAPAPAPPPVAAAPPATPAPAECSRRAGAGRRGRASRRRSGGAAADPRDPARRAASRGRRRAAPRRARAARAAEEGGEGRAARPCRKARNPRRQGGVGSSGALGARRGAGAHRPREEEEGLAARLRVGGLRARRRPRRRRRLVEPVRVRPARSGGRGRAPRTSSPPRRSTSRSRAGSRRSASACPTRRRGTRARAASSGSSGSSRGRAACGT